MKSGISSLLFGSALLLVTSSSFAETVEIEVDNLLAPVYGYEEKNNIDLVVYGSLPNVCYSLDEYKIEKDLTNHVVQVRQFANLDRTGICEHPENLPAQMQMKIPFVTEISLGRLKVGDFKIAYLKTGGLTGVRPLNISPNQAIRVDTLPYAAVSNVHVPEMINGRDEIEVKITGFLNSTCTVLEDQVQVLPQDDVLVLLPTLKTKTGVVCAEVLVPFEKVVNLGKRSPGHYLIHTRSMNGKSINRVIRVSK